MRNFLLLLCTISGITFGALSQITIAVLPYQVNYEGRIPKKYTPEMIEESRLQEGMNYQVSMINYLTKMANKRKNVPLDVTVLGNRQIEALLEQKGITSDQVAGLSNQQLEEMLGVTHVVRGTVTRTFIMSDELSLGITAVSVVTGQPLMNATSNLSVINGMENAHSNGMVYSRQHNRTTSATRSDEQSLRDTFRKSSRNMMRRLRQAN